MTAPIRYTSINAPDDNGCDECTGHKNDRAFCDAHRQGKPCLWCLGCGFRVSQNRWEPCPCDV